MLKLLATGLAASFLLLPPAQAAPPAPYGVQPHQQAVQRAGEQRQRQLQEQRQRFDEQRLQLQQDQLQRQQQNLQRQRQQRQMQDNLIRQQQLDQQRWRLEQDPRRSAETGRRRETLYTAQLFSRGPVMANSYLEHHLALLQHLRNILGALGEAEQVPEENHGLFLERFDELMDELPRDPEGAQYLGQDLISQVFHRYPQIAHLVPRDLLWFFGGDCLHFMPDEEIDLFQRLDERRYEAEERGETFDWNREKQLLALPEDSPRH